MLFLIDIIQEAREKGILVERSSFNSLNAAVNRIKSMGTMVVDKQPNPCAIRVNFGDKKYLVHQVIDVSGSTWYVVLEPQARTMPNEYFRYGRHCINEQSKKFELRLVGQTKATAVKTKKAA